MEIINDQSNQNASGVHKLYRSRNGKIGGVCQGLADYMNCDVVLVRVLAAVGLFVPCVPAFLAYIVMWLIVPLEPQSNRNNQYNK